MAQMKICFLLKMVFTCASCFVKTKQVQILTFSKKDVSDVKIRNVFFLFSYAEVYIKDYYLTIIICLSSASDVAILL
jgi:hypothetical protein